MALRSLRRSQKKSGMRAAGPRGSSLMAGRPRPAVPAICSIKNAAGIAAFFFKGRSNYFETDFLNMRSIFSLVASHEACAAWAADSAWLAVLCAPLAAVEA